MQSKHFHGRASWEIPLPRDPYLHLSIRRSTLIAFLGSLIVHALVLFVAPHQPIGTSEPIAKSGDSLVVNLRPRTPARGEQASPTAILETRPKPRVDKRQKASSESLAAVSIPRRQYLNSPVTPAIPKVPSSAAAEPVEDLQAYINAARARRQNAQSLSSRELEETASNAREPSEDEIRMAIVKRNLNRGTNGVFQILSMESRRAAFSFRGWTNDSSNFHREYIQVEIGANSDIEIAIVRKMIELIRRYFNGNFNWESDRLDRIVVLSARPEDNDVLEEFMLKEFFRAESRIPRVR